MYPKDLSAVEHLPTRARIAIERRIVLRLIDDALAAGCELSVDDGGDAPHPWTRDRSEVIDTIMETDEDVLRYRLNGERLGAVMLVYGNDGWDVIADYSVRLEPYLAGANALAESLEA